MIKTDYENRNYAYVVYEYDHFLENIIYVADSLQEMADYLGVTLSEASRLVSRRVVKHYNHIAIERVRIYEYVYVIYENNLTRPYCVAKNINELSKKSKIPYSSLLTNLSHAKYKLRGKYNQRKKLLNKFYADRVDLLDLDFNLAEFLRNCLKQNIVTENFELNIEEQLWLIKTQKEKRKINI